MSALSQNDLSPSEQDLLAAEYVLGALDAAARAQAESLAKSDPEFAARIAGWQDRMAGLNDGYAAVPAPDLLPKIEARLFGTAPKSRLDALKSLFRPNWSWHDWSWLDGLAGTALLTAVSVVLLALMLKLNPAPDLTTTLRADASPQQFRAHLIDGNLTVDQAAGTPPAQGRSYELWILVDGAAPQSLGLIDGTITLPAPSAETGYVLAVTDEPFGGGPGGKPTGAIIAAGKFEAI